MNLLNCNLKNDFYYSDNLAKVYLQDGDGVFHFDYSEGTKQFLTLGIKRPIRKIGKTHLDGMFFDVETPYGYGGYYTNSDDSGFVKRALELYSDNCRDNNIIAEFVRFHPLNSFPQKFAKEMDFCSNDRKTVYVKMDRNYKDICKDYGSVLKRNIKKAEKNNLEFAELANTDDSIEAFADLYYATMLHNRAKNFYFFKHDYFRRIMEFENVKMFGVYSDDELINAVIVYESYPLVYYHLGATNPERYALNGNSFIFNRLIEVYAGLCMAFFLGGGTSGAEDDSLLAFKQRFSHDTWDFYIGGKIFNRKKYKEYVNIWKNGNPKKDAPFFLKYRLHGK